MPPMDISSLRLLVVEDHDFQRSIAVSQLRQLGAEGVLEASDGADALAKLRPDFAQRGAVDVMVCDLDMPGMDGVELIRHVATEQLVRSLILLSGLDTTLISSVENMARAHGIPVLGIIEKPVSLQKLSNLLVRFAAATEPLPHVVTAKITADELERGLVRKEFVAYFQPKVDMNTQAVVGAEALARWRHPEKGLLQPQTFIGIAEQTELINGLSWAMLEQALQAQREWAAQGLVTRVAVNLSLAYLGQIGVAERITALVREANVDCQFIILEVTESLVTTNMAHVLENLARLRMRGFGISIDDYGTGFSSMQQLSRIPFTELKVDQSFVAGAAAKPNIRTILESSLQLAKKLGLSSVAEGVERQEEWALLLSMGCDIAQGYFISRALAPEAFVDWSRAWNSQIPHKAD